LSKYLADIWSWYDGVATLQFPCWGSDARSGKQSCYKQWRH
jgi:hypothetical protein